jgi:hypothetical protein
MTDKNNQDDVIKNPARSISFPQRRYEPEYVKMGIDPEVRNITVGRDLPEQKIDDEMSALDGIPLDDLGNAVSIMNGQIIDNNEFVSFPTLPRPTITPKSKEPEHVAIPEQPKVGDYILMVMGKMIASGTLDIVQSRVKSIMYGDDIAFRGMNVNADDIVVLKRVGIKIGVFLDV